MFVSFLQAQPVARRSVWQARQDMPPFWELEALIADGHDLDMALLLMSMRRDASNDTLDRVSEYGAAHSRISA